MPLRHRVTLVVSFGPSPTPVLDVAVEHARRHADALEHLGRTYRATYVLGHDAVHLGRALQLLRMVKGWRATTVEVDGDPEDRAVALAMLTCSREWLGRQGRVPGPVPGRGPAQVPDVPPVRAGMGPGVLGQAGVGSDRAGPRDHLGGARSRSRGLDVMAPPETLLGGPTRASIRRPMLQTAAEEDPGWLSTGQFRLSWLEHARTTLRPTTHEGYEALIRRHALPRIGGIPLGELRPLQIQALYAEVLAAPGARTASGYLSAKTVANLHRVLRRSLHQAQRWGLIPANPAASAEPPRARRPELAVVDRDLATGVLEHADGTRFEAPVAIALATGMRRGEILGLTWGDLDGGWAVARIARSLEPTASGLVSEEPKTARSRRSVTLPAFLGPYLARQRTDQQVRRETLQEDWSDLDLVVDSGDGSPWHPDRFSSAFAWFLHRAGLPHIRFHDLRHGHATLMLLKGIHPKIVSERLGHSSIGITLDTYSHVLPSMQTEAARAFDELFARA